MYCADYFYGLWSQNSEWWAMLLEAQAGDVLFGTFHAGPNDGFIHFRFDGHGRDILSGITFADADGNYIPGSLNGVSLLDIFNGQSSINYHGSNPTFEWSGLFRPAEGGMPLLPYVRESNRTEAFFTSEQVTWDSRFKGITGSIVGGLIVAEFCGGYCGLVAGAFAGQGAGEAMWFGWDEYGRQLNDRYWNVGGYHLTFRFNPNEGYSLIYYSGLGNGVVPFWLR